MRKFVLLVWIINIVLSYRSDHTVEANIFHGDSFPTESPAPSPGPSSSPSIQPSLTVTPSITPTVSLNPSYSPSSVPTRKISRLPTESPAPSPSPSNIPTNSPTRFSVTMSIPLNITLPGIIGQVKLHNIKKFQDSVLQFLQENLVLLHQDMTVDFLSAIVQMQQFVKEEPALIVIVIITVEIFDSSQKLPDNFDVKDTLDHPFDTNVTGFINTTGVLEVMPPPPPFEEHPFVSVSAASSAQNSYWTSRDAWVGFLAISISILILLIVIFVICCRYRRKSKEVAAAVELESNDDDDPVLSEVVVEEGGLSNLESWKSEDGTSSSIVEHGLAAKNLTVNVHRCHSAMCPVCKSAQENNRTTFLPLSPSMSWTRLHNVWNQSKPTSILRSKKRRGVTVIPDLSEK